MHPWVEQLTNTEFTPDKDTTQSLDFYWAQVLLDAMQLMTREAVIDLKGLNLVFVADEIGSLPLNQRIGFCNFINRLCEDLATDFNISVVTTGSTVLDAIPDISSFWSDSMAEALSIQLENLTRDETFRLLESHDLDSNLITKIYNQTDGNPGKIKSALKDQDLQAINLEESYTRGKNMMYQFNNFQRRWIQWAAIIRNCNEETISLITEGPEVVECMNWIRNSYPNYFDREGSDYILKTEIRRAISTYVQRNDPTLFAEINDVVKRLSSVKHAIPNSNHRFLLSKLGELNYFDMALLKKVFSDDDYKALLNLIENKPIFFRQELNSYRLSSNVRAAIGIYNNLKKNPEREKFRYRVKTLWLEKQKDLSQKISRSEKDLNISEDRNRSLTQSLSKIETELQKLKLNQKRSAPPPQVTQIQAPKRLSLIGAIFFQTIGIGILYIYTLVMQNMSVSYLFLSGICIVAGIVLGVKGPGKSVVVASNSAVVDTPRSKNYDAIVSNLEIDLLNLASQKELAQRQIEKDKLHISNLKIVSKHSYLAEN